MCNLSQFSLNYNLLKSLCEHTPILFIVQALVHIGIASFPASLSCGYRQGVSNESRFPVLPWPAHIRPHTPWRVLLRSCWVSAIPPPGPTSNVWESSLGHMGGLYTNLAICSSFSCLLKTGNFDEIQCLVHSVTKHFFPLPSVNPFFWQTRHQSLGLHRGRTLGSCLHFP
jgi:hypothetical protein